MSMNYHTDYSKKKCFSNFLKRKIFILEIVFDNVSKKKKKTSFDSLEFKIFKADIYKLSLMENFFSISCLLIFFVTISLLAFSLIELFH